MKAVEFEATAYDKILHLPEGIPDGKKMRVLLLFDESSEDNNQNDLKSQLSNLTEKLADADLSRQNDKGRDIAI